MSGEFEYTEWRRTGPRVIVDCDTREALPLLRQYYSARANGRPLYSGGRAPWTGSRGPATVPAAPSVEVYEFG
jgi:hypothetical protein